MIFLNASQTELLLHSPESGMGFQFVDVAMKGGPWLSGVAYNAQKEQGEASTKLVSTWIRDEKLAHGTMLLKRCALPMHATVDARVGCRWRDLTGRAGSEATLQGWCASESAADDSEPAPTRSGPAWIRTRARRIMSPLL